MRLDGCGGSGLLRVCSLVLLVLLLRGHRSGRRRGGDRRGRRLRVRPVLKVDAPPPAALDGLGGVDLDNLEAVLRPVHAVAAGGHRRDVLSVLLLDEEEGRSGGVRGWEKGGREEIL